jgi:hypothetical protein
MPGDQHALAGRVTRSCNEGPGALACAGGQRGPLRAPRRSAARCRRASTRCETPMPHPSRSPVGLAGCRAEARTVPSPVAFRRASGRTKHECPWDSRAKVEGAGARERHDEAGPISGRQPGTPAPKQSKPRTRSDASRPPSTCRGCSLPRLTGCRVSERHDAPRQRGVIPPPLKPGPKACSPNQRRLIRHSAGARPGRTKVARRRNT